MKKTQLMGILNCTPDSFYDGSCCFDAKTAIEKAEKMIKEGVDIIDIGGESTRPGSIEVDFEEEKRRVLPTILAMKGKIALSIDTKKSAIAELAIENGVGFLNDISGFCDEKMRKIAADSQVKICLMHMQGTPETMQKNPNYPKGVIVEIKEWFQKKVDILIQDGVDPKNIILDPGIGFGKTVEHNLEIIKNLSEFKELGFKILIGLSRKSFMQKILQKSARDLLSTTLVLNTISILAGVEMIRVHDVAEHRDCLDILHNLNNEFFTFHSSSF